MKPAIRKGLAIRNDSVLTNCSLLRLASFRLFFSLLINMNLFFSKQNVLFAKKLSVTIYMFKNILTWNYNLRIFNEVCSSLSSAAFLGLKLKTIRIFEFFFVSWNETKKEAFLLFWLKISTSTMTGCVISELHILVQLLSSILWNMHR